MDGDLDLLDLVSVLLPGDRLLSLLVGIALDDLLLSDLPLGDLDLDLVLEALLVLEARLVHDALLVLDDNMVLRPRVEGVLDLLLL